MQNETIIYALLGALAIALAVAAYTDATRRKIYNWLVVAIALAAPVWWWAIGLDTWPGMGWQLGVALATFAVGALLFAFRVMGGGDVKLLAVLGLWFTPLLFLQFLFFMALIGGLLTVLIAAHKVARRRKDISVPYGVAIAAAGLWIIWSEYAEPLARGGISA